MGYKLIEYMPVWKSGLNTIYKYYYISKNLLLKLQVIEIYLEID